MRRAIWALAVVALMVTISHGLPKGATAKEDAGRWGEGDRDPEEIQAGGWDEGVLGTKQKGGVLATLRESHAAVVKENLEEGTVKEGENEPETSFLQDEAVPTPHGKEPPAPKGKVAPKLPSRAAIKAAGGTCMLPKIPAKFHVNENVVDAGWSFDVKSVDGKTKYGSVSESLMNFEKKLEWNLKSTREATGIQAAISWGNEVAITDCHGTKLADLRERVFSGFIHNKYYIRDAQGKIAGKSYKAPAMVNAFGTPEFVIKSADGQRTLVTIRRPVFSWGDQWQITRTAVATKNPQDELAQDPRVLVMLAAFTTAHNTSGTKGFIWGSIFAGCAIVLCGFCGFAYVILKRIRESDAGGYQEVHNPNTWG